jgi:mRNA interferase MazF
MAGILRGEIRWADLDPVRGHEQGGRRPVLVISHDVFNDHSGTVITLKLDEAGLPKESWIKISQVRTVSTERIGERIGRADADTIARVVEGWNEICG